MTLAASPRPPILGGFLTGAALLLAVAGCSQPPAPPPARTKGAPAAEKAESAKAQTAPVAAAAPDLARLHQSFKDAVLLDPVDGEQLPDLTCTGKNTAKLFEAIAGKDFTGGLWDQVRFLNEQGKRLTYRAVLTTALGEIQIDLYADAAPNHVRSFVALARAGYFDGLPIYKSERQTDGDKVVAGYIESGCPRGTGEFGYGSIGYWLKPEIEGNKHTHEEGAVGAWHREELETAACRFYITTEKIPSWDGNYTVFGKVTRGLDVVRTINSRPVEEKTNQLKEPVPIKGVVIQVVEEGPAATLHAN